MILDVALSFFHVLVSFDVVRNQICEKLVAFIVLFCVDIVMLNKYHEESIVAQLSSK